MKSKQPKITHMMGKKWLYKKNQGKITETFVTCGLS